MSAPHPTTWTSCAVALGSNEGGALGTREEHLHAALALLERSPEVRGLRASAFVETEPDGGPPGQPLFLNGAAVLETTLSPLRMLRLLQRIEARRGRDREREVRNGARTLDLDLLVHGQALLATPELQLPHPRMSGRRFVLGPLATLAADLVPPGWGRSVAQALAVLPETGADRSPALAVPYVPLP